MTDKRKVKLERSSNPSVLKLQVTEQYVIDRKLASNIQELLHLFIQTFSRDCQEMRYL